jgi:hypothetical protein
MGPLLRRFPFRYLRSWLWWRSVERPLSRHPGSVTRVFGKIARFNRSFAAIVAVSAPQ